MPVTRNYIPVSFLTPCTKFPPETLKMPLKSISIRLHYFTFAEITIPPRFYCYHTLNSLRVFPSHFKKFLSEQDGGGMSKTAFPFSFPPTSRKNHPRRRLSRTPPASRVALGAYCNIMLAPSLAFGVPLPLLARFAYSFNVSRLAGAVSPAVPLPALESLAGRGGFGFVCFVLRPNTAAITIERYTLTRFKALIVNACKRNL